MQSENKMLIVEPKRSHNVKGTKLFKEMDKELIYKVFRIYPLSDQAHL